MTELLHLSAYRFAPLDELPQRRERIEALARAAHLKGTVLLAEEGINLFLAGAPAPLLGFLDALRQDPALEPLDGRRTRCAAPPYRHLRVKVKREIIRMDQPMVRPQQGRAPSVLPADLARWIAQGHDDQGHELVLLDTRNSFEVARGRFAGALDWGLSRFSEFPQAAREHVHALKGKAVVSYCTGGIRCEKAALVLSDCGLDAVYQLEDDILRHFEDTGGAGFEGTCFVFDERVELDARLTPVAS